MDICTVDVILWNFCVKATGWPFTWNCNKYEKSEVGSKVGELLENLETITERHEEVVERTLSGEIVLYAL